MLQLHGGLGLGFGLVLGFYSVRHLMNGWDLKYTFSQASYSEVNPSPGTDYVHGVITSRLQTQLTANWAKIDVGRLYQLSRLLPTCPIYMYKFNIGLPMFPTCPNPTEKILLCAP